MGNTLTERADIIEALKWLEGRKVKIKGNGTEMECEIKKVREGLILSKDKTSHFNGVEMETDTGVRIPLQFPRLVEETTTGFELDFSLPFEAKTDDEKRHEAEADDKKFYDFLRAGRGHKFHSVDWKKPRVIIEVLD